MLTQCGNVPNQLRQFVQPHYEVGLNSSFGNQTTENTIRCMSCFPEHLHWRLKTVNLKCPMPCKEVIFQTKVEILGKPYDRTQLHKSDAPYSYSQILYDHKRLQNYKSIHQMISFSDVGS